MGIVLKEAGYWRILSDGYLIVCFMWEYVDNVDTGGRLLALNVLYLNFYLENNMLRDTRAQ